MAVVRGTTERHVLVFGAGGWQRCRAVAEQYLAKRHLRPLLFPETGHAVIEKVPKRVLTRLRAMNGLKVRAEPLFVRPSSLVGAPPASSVFLGDADRSWPLIALGLRADAQDGAGIQVGLIDSGVELGHPALVGSVSAGSADGGVDSLGHGTHCAGVIVGRKLSAGPRFGLAPRAHVRSYRLFDATRQATEGRVRDLVSLAVKDGCHVIVLAGGVESLAFTPEDATLGNWLTSIGRLMVAAAGNESNRSGRDIRPTLAPANAPGVYAIGAHNSGLRLWNSSNGLGIDPATRVDAVAPGVDVLSAWPGGRTQFVTGSSAATAIAGGLAAALWSRRPSLRAADLSALMLRLARRNVNGEADGIGAGALAFGAI
jgi:subtilisin family serine protease